MSEEVTEEDIQHISDLALLEVPEDQTEEFKSQFNDILDKFSRLDEVDLEDVDEEEHRNVLREDSERAGIDAEEFMKEQDRETDSRYFEN